MNALPVTEHLNYAPIFGMLVALALGSTIIGVLFHSEWNTMLLVMLAVACICPAGIALTRATRSISVGSAAMVAMVAASMAGMIFTVMSWRPAA